MIYLWFASQTIIAMVFCLFFVYLIKDFDK